MDPMCKKTENERSFVSKDKESNGIDAWFLEAFQFAISTAYDSYEDPQFMYFILYEVQRHCTSTLRFH